MVSLGDGSNIVRHIGLLGNLDVRASKLGR
jgi:hypothetical protein